MVSSVFSGWNCSRFAFGSIYVLKSQNIARMDQWYVGPIHHSLISPSFHSQYNVLAPLTSYTIAGRRPGRSPCALAVGNHSSATCSHARLPVCADAPTRLPARATQSLAHPDHVPPCFCSPTWSWHRRKKGEMRPSHFVPKGKWIILEYSPYRMNHVLVVVSKSNARKKNWINLSFSSSSSETKHICSVPASLDHACVILAFLRLSTRSRKHQCFGNGTLFALDRSLFLFVILFSLTQVGCLLSCQHCIGQCTTRKKK